MTAAAASSAATAASTFLSGLTPQGLQALGHHLTASAEAQALALVSQMTTPALALALYGSLAAVPNVPQKALTWAGMAATATDPNMFGMDKANVISALQDAVVAPGILGSLGL